MSIFRQVTTEEGEAAANELGVMFIEASAKNGANVKQVGWMHCTLAFLGSSLHFPWRIIAWCSALSGSVALVAYVYLDAEGEYRHRRVATRTTVFPRESMPI